MGSYRKVGHSSVQVIDAYYSHFFEDEFKQAANSMSDIFKKYNKKDEIPYSDPVYFLQFYLLFQFIHNIIFSQIIKCFC